LSPVPIRQFSNETAGDAIDGNKGSTYSARHSWIVSKRPHVVQIVLYLCVLISLADTVADIVYLGWDEKTGGVAAQVRNIILWIGTARDLVVCGLFAWFTVRFWRRGASSGRTTVASNAGGFSEYNHRTTTRLMYIAVAGFISFLFLNVRNTLIYRRFIAGNVAAVVTLIAVENITMTVRGAALLLVLSIPSSANHALNRSFKSDLTINSTEDAPWAVGVSKAFEKRAWQAALSKEEEANGGGTSAGET